MRATNKLLQRIGPATVREGEASTTGLGEWYGTVLFWRPQVVLLVNEKTLVPVLLPLAPAAGLLARLPEQIGRVLVVHGASPVFLEEERRQMSDARVAKTANRSVVGVLTEFARLAEVYRSDASAPDLLALAVRLAGTPCGPLYHRNVSPDRELAAYLRTRAG